MVTIHLFLPAHLHTCPNCLYFRDEPTSAERSEFWAVAGSAASFGEFQVSYNPE
jgi:hypothetical protein